MAPAVGQTWVQAERAQLTPECFNQHVLVQANVEGSQRPFDQYSYLPHKTWGVSAALLEAGVGWHACGPEEMGRQCHSVTRSAAVVAPPRTPCLTLAPCFLASLLCRATRSTSPRPPSSITTPSRTASAATACKRAACCRCASGLAALPLPRDLPHPALRALCIAQRVDLSSLAPYLPSLVRRRHWVTGNSCTPPGTPEEFQEPQLGTCGVDGPYPEEFW